MTKRHIILGSFVCMVAMLGSCEASPRSRTGQKQGPLKVLILGDSISVGYTQSVGEYLHGRAVVFRPMRKGGKTAENCEGTTRGVASVERWLAIDGGEFDVVHFNFGLHDIKHLDPDTSKATMDPSDPHQASLKVYSEQLEEIVEHLLQSGSALVFATTTPVPQGGVRPYRDPEDVVRYNAVAIEIMNKNGIAINDLYTFVLPQLEDLQQPVNVHFNSAGSNALAERVVDSILLNGPSR